MRTLTFPPDKKPFIDLIRSNMDTGAVIVDDGEEEVFAALSMQDYEWYRQKRLDEFFAVCDEIGRKAQERGMTKEILEEILADTK